MNELALFAGVGGGLLASRLLGWTTICAVEISPYCREVLLRRQRDGLLDMFPIWDDVRTFDGRAWRGAVDIVSAGFPCQPYSIAGKRKGREDDRNLWPQTRDIVRDCQPALCFFENVPALLIDPYFETILRDLEALGYYVPPPEIVSANEVGAPFLGERLFFVATSACVAQQNREGSYPAVGRQGFAASVGANTKLASANGERCQERRLHLRRREQAEAPAEPSWLGEVLRGGDGTWRKVKPGLPLLADGVAFGMERLRSSGNGIVPQQMCEAWRRLTEDIENMGREE